MEFQSEHDNKQKPASKRFLLAGLYTAAFLIPVCIMVLISVLIGMEPFGGRSFMVSDIHAQFAAFYTYQKHLLLSGDFSLYSLSKTLGGDMAGFFGYYSQNPFVLILLLFPDAKIAVGIWWMDVVQIGCMGLSAYTFLNCRPDALSADPSGKKAVHLMFSTAYALMGYAIAYLTLPLYFCSLILLPLIILGLERFLRQRKQFLLYVLTLAAAIWCNYYLGYMICIFCGLYVMRHLIANRMRMKTLFEFIAISVLAPLLDAFSLIPVVLSLSGEKAAPGAGLFSLSKTYPLWALFKNMLPGTFTCNFTNLCAPYIYVGLVTLCGCIVYFLFSTIARREKITWLVFLLCLLLSTWIYGADTVWHAFNAPVGYAHRQAFLICFVQVLLADEGLRHTKFTIKPVILLAASLVLFAELGANVYLSMRAYVEHELADQQEYEAYVNRFGAFIDSIRQKDEGLYRIEKDTEYNHNDAMLFSYNGLTHNSSCEKDYVRIFMGRMGFRNQGIWSFYNQGSTTFTDCLLGVKYFISRFDSTNKPYLPLINDGQSFAFQNPYALPLAFGITADAADTDMRRQDLFAIQNDLALETGGVSDIYTEAQVAESLQNLSVETVQTGGENERAGLGISGPDTCTRYFKTDGSSGAQIDYAVSVDRPCNLYCYFSAPAQQGCNLYVDGATRDEYFSDYRWSVVNCGNFVAGETVTVTLEVTGEDLKLYDAYFYMEDTDRLAAWYGNVQEMPVTLTQTDRAHYTGQIRAAEDARVIVSVPYEEGWTVKVDGKKVETEKKWEALLSFTVESGTHTLTFSYFPQGMRAGILLSVLAALVTAFLTVFTRKKGQS